MRRLSLLIVLPLLWVNTSVVQAVGSICFRSSFVVEPQYVEVGMTSCPSDNNTDAEPDEADEELTHSNVEN